MTLTDSVGDTTMVLRSQDDGVIQTFRAITNTDSSRLDIFVDTGDVILEMNKGELIDAIAKEAKLSLTNSGAHFNLKAFGYEGDISVTNNGFAVNHIDSTGDTLAVWRSDNDTSQIKLGTTDGGVEMVNTDSIAAIRLLDRLVTAPMAVRLNDPIPGIDIIVEKNPSGPHREIAIGPTSGYNGIIAVSDTSGASLRLGGGGSPAVTSGSDGVTARLSLDGRSSFDPNGGAIAFAASPAGCTLVVMDGLYDTTLMVDQGGNMRTDGQVSVGTPEQLATLTVAGDICATGSIGACSDARFKTNVSQLENALQLVSQMRGVSYQWNRESYPERHFPDRPQVGLVAQELLSVVPEVVTVDAAGYYSVDYGKLTPVLVEAIKEQQITINSQSTEIRKMQDELTELKALVQQLVDRPADKAGPGFVVK